MNALLPPSFETATETFAVDPPKAFSKPEASETDTPASSAMKSINASPRQTISGILHLRLYQAVVAVLSLVDHVDVLGI